MFQLIDKKISQVNSHKSFIILTMTVIPLYAGIVEPDLDPNWAFSISKGHNP